MQMSLVKMRSHWSRLGPNPIWPVSYFLKKGCHMKRHAQRNGQVQRQGQAKGTGPAQTVPHTLRGSLDLRPEAPGLMRRLPRGDDGETLHAQGQVPPGAEPPAGPRRSQGSDAYTCKVLSLRRHCHFLAAECGEATARP